MPALDAARFGAPVRQKEQLRTLRLLAATPLSLAGLLLLVFFLLVALAAPLLAPPSGADPYHIPRDGFSGEPKPPGTEWRLRPPPLPVWWEAVTGRDEWVHLFGTTSGQWDIYYGVVWGARTALTVGFMVGLSSALIGILVGGVSAYYGGLVDTVLMRITDVFLVFPGLIAALTLVTLLTPRLGRSITPILIALVAFGWMGYARIIRGDILSVKQRDFILSARAIGASDARILLRHILPNAIHPTLVLVALNIGTMALAFAGLSFLGVGIEPGYADWGQMISFARDWMPQLSQYWYIVLFPGGALLLYTLAWSLLGDALRDIFDPHLAGRRR